MDFWDDMIERGRSTEGIAAVSALVIPGEVDLITGGAPSDQARLLNPMLIHRGPREG